MQQYFSNKKLDNQLILKEEDIHHIKNVMRIKPDNEVIVNYDGVSYVCKLNKDYKSVNIESIYKDIKEQDIVLYMPVLSDEKMSFIIEKGTEMGITKFLPVNYKHCKFKLDKDKEEKKLIRYNKIAKEASEQSRRVNIPIVTNIIDVNSIKCSDVNILCSLDKENVKSIKSVINTANIYDKINIVFGPEGGLSAIEEDYLVSIGYVKTSLGSNVLRTETIVIVICGIINYIKGE